MYIYMQYIYTYTILLIYKYNIILPEKQWRYQNILKYKKPLETLPSMKGAEWNEIVTKGIDCMVRLYKVSSIIKFI